MADCRIPGPLGSGVHDLPIDLGTLGRWRSARPGSIGAMRGGAPPFASELDELASGADPAPAASDLGDRRAAGGLSLSAAGADLLQQVEDLRLKPYNDQTQKAITAWVAGATIGYGHLISRGEWPLYQDGIDRAAAAALFERDLAPSVGAVRGGVSAKLTQNEFDALVILAFNIGVAAFGSSSVLKLVNDPAAITSYAGLEQAWKAWNKSQGTAMKGLDNRRHCEWTIYTRGIYERW